MHYAAVPLPGPRMPHDMAFTEHYVVLNDLPMFWDPDAAEARRLRQPLPPGHAGAVRRSSRAAGHGEDVRWFEASPTNVLHWINAYEDGDEVVLDGFHQGCPDPRKDGDDRWAVTSRYLDANELQTRGPTAGAST